jgi:hypothetical protein
MIRALGRLDDFGNVWVMFVDRVRIGEVILRSAAAFGIADPGMLMNELPHRVACDKGNLARRNCSQESSITSI